MSCFLFCPTLQIHVIYNGICMFSGLNLSRKTCKIWIEKTMNFDPNFAKNLKHTPKIHKKIQESHPTVNFEASKGQEKHKWAQTWSKRRRFQPKVDSKGGAIHFGLRTAHREGPVGKGRVGVLNWFICIVFSVQGWASTRPEAQGSADSVFKA